MSFFQALSGFNAAARNRVLSGNQIANLNSVVDKSSRGEIQDFAATPQLAKTESIIMLEVNLDFRASRPVGIAPLAVSAIEPADEVIDTQDTSSYNSLTSSTIYDAKGLPVVLSLYFQKLDVDTWNIYATANGQTITGVAGEDSSAMRPLATLNFPAGGASLTAPRGGLIDCYNWSASGVVTTTLVVNGIINLPKIPVVFSGAGVMSMPISGLQLNLNRSTQYRSDFAVSQFGLDCSAPAAWQWAGK